MTRKEIMLVLNIQEDDIELNPDVVIEKLFCSSILNLGTQRVASILYDYNNLKNTLFFKE